MTASLKRIYAYLLAALAVFFACLLPRELSPEELVVVAILGLVFASAVLLVLDHPAGRPVFYISASAGLLLAAFMAWVGGFLLFLDPAAAQRNGWGWLLPMVVLAGIHLLAGFFIVGTTKRRAPESCAPR